MKRTFFVALTFALHLSAQVFLTETFNDTNGTALSAHTSDNSCTYTAPNASYNSAVTINNTGSVTDSFAASNGGLWLPSCSGATTNQSVTVGMRGYTAIGHGVGVLLRASADGQNGYFVQADPAAGVWSISRFTGNSATVLTTTPYTFATGVVTWVATVVDGPNGRPPIITISISGTPILTYTDSSALLIHKTGTRVILFYSSFGATLSASTGLHLSSVSAAATLLAGLPVVGTITTTTVNLTTAVATGGTSPYTYQWYRSLSSGFTPGAGNIISGATSTTLADTPPSTGPWYYKVVATDAASATNVSAQVAAYLQQTSDSICAIGDSITLGQGLTSPQAPAIVMQEALKAIAGPRVITVSNQGHGGATTADWLIGSGTGYLSTAKTACAALTPAATIAVIELGANDAPTVSPATYGANLAAIAANLVSSGYTKVILSYPTYISPYAGTFNGTEISVTNAALYQAQVDAAANGSTIVVGDRTEFGLFIDHQGDWLQSDLVHPNVAGASALGNLWAQVVARAMGWISCAGGGLYPLPMAIAH